MLNFYQEDKWRVSVQEEDGLNNHYYIFPKNKQLFWQLAQSNGGIILRFIGKYAQQLPVEEHSIFVSNIPHKSDVATFIRTSTIGGVDISKKFKDTIILAAPKGAEDALAYRLADFNQGNETIRVEKEIKRQNHLHRPFQEPLGPEPKRQGSSVSAHAIYPRDISKKANAIRKANFLCEISNNHPLFKSRITNQNYLEAHHLIPLKYADLFSFSLDIEANIVAVCPHCHRLLHYGDKEEIKPILEQLFIERKNLLASKGIHLTLEQLYAFYGSAD